MCKWEDLSTVNIELLPVYNIGVSLHSKTYRTRGVVTVQATEACTYIQVAIPAEERTCHNCYEGVEVEIHFLTSCKSTELQRKVLYEHIRKSLTLSFTFSLTRTNTSV